MDFLFSMFLDDAAISMTNPTMVYIRELDEEVAEGQTKYPIAVMTQEDDSFHKFIEVCKNRAFISEHGDPELAYNEYLKSLEAQKEVKIKESETRISREMVEMVLVMKCCMIAYGQSCIVCEMGQKTFEEIEDMFKTSTFPYLHIISPYFAVGISANITVNDAKAV